MSLNKRMFALAATGLFTSAAVASPVFPDYEANELCGDMIAAQVASGDAKPTETAELLAMCRFGVEMFKPIASGLWERSEDASRSACLIEAEEKAEENGVEHVWYGHLAECLSPSGSGKGDRLDASEGSPDIPPS